MKLQDAKERLKNLAFQREINATVSLDLEDCRAIRTVLEELDGIAQEESTNGK